MKFREQPVGPPCKLCKTPTERQCKRCLMPWCEAHSETLRCRQCSAEKDAIVAAANDAIANHKRGTFSALKNMGASGLGLAVSGSFLALFFFVGNPMSFGWNLLGVFSLMAFMGLVTNIIFQKIGVAYHLSGSLWNRLKFWKKKKELAKPKPRLELPKSNE